jgi:hypothetical protein
MGGGGGEAVAGGGIGTAVWSCGRVHVVGREEGQTHATNNGSPFCTHYVAIYYCCSGSLASSLARSLHLPLRHVDLVGVAILGCAALLTFGREDTAAVPKRKMKVSHRPIVYGARRCKDARAREVRVVWREG